MRDRKNSLGASSCGWAATLHAGPPWKFLPMAVVFVAVSASPSISADDGGTRSPLLMGVGARSLAMGRTAVAFTAGADALFWNPARLSAIQRPQLDVFHTRLTGEGLAYHSTLATYPTLDFGTLAVGYQRFGTDDLDGRDARNTPTEYFGFGETHFLLGYGRSLHPNVALGAALRVEQQSVGDLRATGLGLDLGAAFQRDWGEHHRVQAGVNLQNIVEPTLRLDQEGVADPRSLNLGLALGRQPRASRLAWLAAADLEVPRLADPRLGLGAEISFDQLLFLRGGADDGRPTFGFGVAWRGVHVDYAFRSEDDLDRSDRFTVGLEFGPSRAARAEARQAARQHELSDQLGQMLQQRERESLAAARAAADRAYEEGRLEEAIVLYRRILALAPDDAVAAERVDAAELSLQLTAARTALDAGDTGNAAALYREILDRWPDNLEAQDALEQARRSLADLEHRKGQVESLFAAALGFFADGNLDEATRRLHELLRLEPTHALGRELEGRIAAISIQQGERFLASARSAAARTEWPAAFRDLDRAEPKLPDRLDEIVALRTAWIAERDAMEAARLAEARRARASKPVAPAPDPQLRAELERRFRAGTEAFQAGDFQGATRDWRWIWDQAPGFGDVAEQLVTAYLFLGIQAFGQGDYAGAEQHCKRALEVDPDNDKAGRYLANIQEEAAEIQRRKEVGR